ncbi:MATE family efflux transporter [Lactococcus carnosus]|uniref:MATE family efflux transporter n=1 Tax=Pseudolactococcus carnosus TaxID=2749961 RepID=UPI001C4EDBCB|nr:MATE family efflux transporter [Lactococcus carnosus]MCJ1972220.1 hypothetical protein [Lactococcus carnosus]
MLTKIQKFTLPLILTQLLQLLIGQLTMIIAVNKSTNNMAGITTVQSFLYALAGILGAVAFAFNILGSEAVGAKNDKKYQSLIKASLIINLIVGLISGIILVLGGHLFLSVVYGFSGELLKVATWYLLIQSPYVLLILFTFLFTNLLKMKKKTQWILYISTLTMFFNIGINWFFVQYLSWGIIGASLASTCTLTISVLTYGFILRRTLAKALTSRVMAIRDILQKALPLVGQEILEGVILIVVFDALMARLGVNTLALYAICMQAITFIKIPTMMYGNAVTIFVAEAKGNNSVKQDLSSILRITITSSSIFYFSGIILFSLFGSSYASLFVNQELATQFKIAFMIVAILTVFSISYELLKYCLQALGEEKTVLNLTFIVNGLACLIMIIYQFLSMSSFTFLYVMNGLALLLLSITFIWKLKMNLKLM